MLPGDTPTVWIHSFLLKTFIGLMQSEKTFLMSTPKCLGHQIWQIYPRSAGRCTPILTSGGHIWQIYPRSASKCTPIHLVAKFGRSTLDLLADVPPTNALWDIYYGMHLAAILDSSRKGWTFLLFLNNLSSKQSVSIVESCQM